MTSLHMQTSLQKHQLVHNWWNNLFAMALRVLTLHGNVSSNETKSHIIEQHRVRGESTNEPSQIQCGDISANSRVAMVTGSRCVMETKTNACFAFYNENKFKVFFGKWRNFHPNRLIKRVRKNHPEPIRIQSSFIFGRPPRSKIFLISCSCLGRSGKIVGWHPLLEGWRLFFREILNPPLISLQNWQSSFSIILV